MEFPMTIGERIREIFDQMPKECTIDWLARKLHCDRRNVYRIFRKENIDILMLARISRLFGHNFFQDLSIDFEKTPADGQSLLPPDEFIDD